MRGVTPDTLSWCEKPSWFQICSSHWSGPTGQSRRVWTWTLGPGRCQARLGPPGASRRWPRTGGHGTTWDTEAQEEDRGFINVTLMCHTCMSDSFLCFLRVFQPNAHRHLTATSQLCGTAAKIKLPTFLLPSCSWCAASHQVHVNCAALHFHANLKTPRADFVSSLFFPFHAS